MTIRLFITIESLGDGSADRLYRFADGPAPSWDSDNVYLDALLRFPGSVASEVDFRNGGASIGGFSFELIASSTVRPLLYSQRRVQIDTLQSALTTGATSITLQSTTLAGDTIILGHEAIYLSSHGGSGTYTCVRGVLDTQAEPHGVGVRDYVSVFDASKGPVLRFRRVTFGYINVETSTGYSDEVTLWAGLLTQISAPSPERIRVDADGLLSLLSKRTINNKPWRGTEPLVRRFEGQEPDYAAPLFFDGPGTPVGSSSGTHFSLDGKALVKSSWVSAGGRTTAQIRPEDLTADSAPWPSQIAQVWEVQYCSDPDTDPDALPLSNNKITLALQVLTSTDTAGQHGNYDTGQADLGLAIPASRIDIAGAEELRAILGEQITTDSQYIGFDGKPVKALEWLQRLLHPHGVALVDAGGTLKFTLFEENYALVTTTLTEADIVPPPDAPPPAQQRRMDLAFDEIVALYGFRPGRGTITDSFPDAVERYLNRYGDSSQMAMDLGGVSQRAKAEAIAILAVQTWHHEIPQIDLTVLRTRDDIELGDLILLTHSKVYQQDGGVRSVTEEACIVTAKRLDLEKGTIRLRLMDVGVIFNRVGRIAPTAVVEAWTGGTKTLDIKEDYSDSGFQSGALSTYPRDSSGFTAGDKVELCNRDHSVIEGGLEIAYVGTTTLVLTTTPSNTPVAGNLIKLASYNQAASTTKTKYAFIADSNETLGSGNDDAYEWTR